MKILWVALVLFIGGVKSGDVSVWPPTASGPSIVTCGYTFCNPRIVPNLHDRFGSDPARLIDLWFQIFKLSRGRLKSATCSSSAGYSSSLPNGIPFSRDDGNVGRPSDCQRAYLAILEYEGPLPDGKSIAIFQNFSAFFAKVKEMKGARFAFYGEDKSSGELKSMYRRKFPDFSLPVEDTAHTKAQRAQFEDRERSVRRFAPILMSEEASLRLLPPDAVSVDHDKYIVQWSLQYPHILDILNDAMRKGSASDVIAKWKGQVASVMIPMSLPPPPADDVRDNDRKASIIDKIIKETKCADWFPEECALWRWLLWQKELPNLEELVESPAIIDNLTMRYQTAKEMIDELEHSKELLQSIVDEMMILRLVPVAEEAVNGNWRDHVSVSRRNSSKRERLGMSKSRSKHLCRSRHSCSSSLSVDN